MKLIAGNEIRQRLESSPPLIEHLVDAEAQIQMDGVDFTLREVSRFADEPGSVDFDNTERRTPDTTPIEPSGDGWWELPPGAYWIVYNEVVNIPSDVFAFARTRSSVIRSGAQVVTALWDSGYSGRSGSMLLVSNPFGLRLKRDARIIQLIFFGLDAPADSTYDGAYQNENK